MRQSKSTRTLHTVFIILNICFLFLTGSCVANLKGVESRIAGERPRQVSFGISHPPLKGKVGLQEMDALAFSSNALSQLEIRAISTSEFWKWRQPGTENFDWEVFDKKVAFAKKHSLKFFLVLAGDAPSGVCRDSNFQNDEYCVLDRDDSMRSFQRYVEEIFLRGRGVITEVAFGNEWDRPSMVLFPANEFIERANIVYEAAHRILPNAIVVAGSVSAGYLQWEAACSGKINKVIDVEIYEGTRISEYCRRKFPDRQAKVERVLREVRSDAFDIHLYDDPENWGMYVDRIRPLFRGKPIFVSEFGGPNVIFDKYTEEYHAHSTSAYVGILKTLPIVSAYHFKLVEDGKNNVAHIRSAFFRSDLSPKQGVIDAFNKAVKLH